MTALCGGGASSPQAGVQPVITLTGVAIEAFIATVLGMPEVAPLLAPIIAAAISIDIATYCATDPPADPGLTATDVAEALAFPATGQTLAAQGKVLQWFEARYWWQICQCTSTTTPPPITPSNPGNTSTNPGLPTQTAPLCWNVTIPYSVAAGASVSDTQYTDLYQTGLPAGELIPVVIASGTPGFTAQTVQVPNTLTNVTMRATLNESFVATIGAPNVEVHFFGVSSTLVYPYSTINVLIGRTSTTTDPPRPTLDSHINSLALYVTNNDTGPHTGTVSLSWQCPSPVSMAQPCCPPDPLLEQYLAQILALDTAIYEALPIPVTSFAEGTVHSGLTGLGTIALATSAIAVKCTLTTIPGWIGSDALSDPTFYFDVGFLGFETSEGTYAQQRIEHTPQVFTVPVLGYTVAYSLKNGVVASITELTRGP